MLAALQRLWSGSDRFDGQLLTIEGPLGLLPLTPGGPPIWVGGSVRRSVRRAAEFGVGWYGSTNSTMDKLERSIGWYREELVKRGRTGRVALNRLVLIGPSQTQAETLAARYLGPQVLRYVRDGALGPVDSSGLTPEMAYGQYGSGLVMAGDRDHVRAGIEEYRRIGVTDLVARVIPGETPVATAIDTISALADIARTYTQEPRRL